MHNTEQKSLKANRQIRAYQVRVILSDGSNGGIRNFKEALMLAQNENLDLVEINPNSNPPTCKIMDFGQYKYEQKKKLKNKPTTEIVKEIGLTIKTSEHDLTTKTKHIQEWLKENCKVIVKLKFFGREITHPELAVEQMNKITNFLDQETFIIECKPVLSGKYMTMILKSKNNQVPH